MKIVIKATNFDLTESIKNYIEEKIGSLEKYLKHLSEDKKFDIKAFVEIGKITFHHKKGFLYRAEGQIELPKKKKMLRAVSKREDLKTAITEVKDELQRQIKRYKENIKDLREKRARRIKKFLGISYLARVWRRRK